MKWVFVISAILLCCLPGTPWYSFAGIQRILVYGLTAVASVSPAIAMGQIVGINLNNAVVAIGSPSASANPANAIGYQANCWFDPSTRWFWYY